jgi:predicted DNA-binding transcriptional regulator AlpA
VWPPPVQKTANRRPTPEGLARILLNAPAAAAALSISERTFHSLRKRPDFPRSATVVFGPRCVRFRVDALRAFALSLGSAPRIDQKPPQRGHRAPSAPLPPQGGQ